MSDFQPAYEVEDMDDESTISQEEDSYDEMKAITESLARDLADEIAEKEIKKNPEFYTDDDLYTMLDYDWYPEDNEQPTPPDDLKPPEPMCASEDESSEIGEEETKPNLQSSPESPVSESEEITIVWASIIKPRQEDEKAEMRPEDLSAMKNKVEQFNFDEYHKATVEMMKIINDLKLQTDQVDFPTNLVQKVNQCVRLDENIRHLSNLRLDTFHALKVAIWDYLRVDKV